MNTWIRDFSFVFIGLLVMACFALAGGSASAAGNDLPQVNVTAEGTGATKISALQDAWMNAVRNAVGMYMQGKSEVVDDKVTEQIVSLSRGQVNSFSILSEKKDQSGNYILTITATIDKDIMQEAVVAGRQSGTATVDHNAIASLATEQNKIQSHEEMVAELNKMIDFTDCLDYSFETRTEKDKNGKTAIFGVHKLKMNLDKYMNRITEIEKMAEKVASERKEYIYGNTSANKGAILEIKTGKAEYDEIDSIWRRGDGKIYIAGKNYEAFNPLFDYQHLALAIAKASCLIGFKINNFSISSKKYIVRFSISTGDSFDDFSVTSEVDNVEIGIHNELINPMLRSSSTGSIMQFVQKIDMPIELLQTKTINYSYFVEHK